MGQPTAVLWAFWVWVSCRIVVSTVDETVVAISDLARKWSFALTSDVATRVSAYVDLLLKWNTRVNLTGARSVADVLGDHLPDSFALSRFVPEGTAVVDVGSGGGLPGIPLAILRSDCRITLVEPRAKRVAFLNTATRVCGCSNAVVFRSRLEGCDLARFSVAISRATFSPDEWLRVGPPLLVPGGRIILLTTTKGPSNADGLRLVDSLQYETASNTVRWAGCYCST